MKEELTKPCEGVRRPRLDAAMERRESMVAWRAAGINYVRFSQIAAEVTRKCTKRAPKAAEVKTSPATLK
ncbi:hypothetical protein OSTOST_20639, partial [Ostertagia ostertagi]